MHLIFIMLDKTVGMPIACYFKAKCIWIEQALESEVGVNPMAKIGRIFSVRTYCDIFLHATCDLTC